MSSVLDASAFLAYLRQEPGLEIVREALVGGAVIGAVNWAEVLSKLAEGGQDPEEVTRSLTDVGLLGQVLVVRPFDDRQGVEAARLRPLTRGAGLSLGDRACLALASTLRLPALTADRVWKDLVPGVSVELIR